MSKDIQDLIAPVAEAERTFIEEVTAGTSPKENLEEQIETIQLMLEQVNYFTS